MEAQENYRVLLVYRPGVIGERWAKMLSTPPFDLHWAHDGEQGLRALQRKPVQAVVYESHPQRIGVDQLMKAARHCDPRPVQVLLTDTLKVDQLNRCIHAGVDHLESPDTPGETFRKKLEKLLESQAILSSQTNIAEVSPLDRLVGRSAAIAEVKRQLGQLASARSAVLFTGETGTGKTLAAEVLHTASNRADKPFQRVFCPALSRTLVESELFGHEKGAFTDAKTARLGVFERAKEGTVLLEEVGDLPGPTQSAILRLLESGEMRRIGSNQAIRPDVRILFASAEPLADLATRGGIRKNLLYRIEGVRVHLPPLRERPEDVRDLIRYYIPRLSQSLNCPAPRMTRRALHRLAGFNWPGNIRQLLHTLEGMLATHPGEVIDIANIPLHLRGQTSPPQQISLTVGSTLADAEKLLISETLKATGGNKVQAAKMLGIGLRTLYRKIKLYELS